MTSFLKKKKKKKHEKRCCWNCNIWPNWLTSHQSHYCLYYNGMLEFVRKRSMLTVKELKQCKVFLKKFHCQKVDSTRKQTSAIIWEILDSNVKTCKRWQAAHLQRRETFQNLLHIAPVRRTLSGQSCILKFERWYSFYLADQDTAQ